MQTADQADPIYWLERTDTETQRLIRQGSYYNRFTRRFFSDAGIAPGMRVLDVGSGAGDVALLAAEFVGPIGQVVGVDLNPAVLAVARERAAGHANVEFVVGNARELALDETFDAVVGRLILMYHGDPVAALRAFARRVKPGDNAAFQDFNIRPAWHPDSASLPAAARSIPTRRSRRARPPAPGGAARWAARHPPITWRQRSPVRR
jgi:ubiquinone/menaquinone biosynthesis C-methylase UbiE